MEEGFIENWDKLSDSEKEYECSSTANSFVCPYCGYVHDMYEYCYEDINDSYKEFECVNCGKVFERELVDVTNYYTTNKLEHKYPCELALEKQGGQE